MRIVIIMSCFGLASAVSVPLNAQTGKPVVAVENIDDATGSELSSQFTTMIESAIAATGRFRLIERTRLDAMERECNRMKSGVVKLKRAGSTATADACSAAAIDYQIYGGITTAQVRQTSNSLCGMLVKDMVCTGVEVTLAVDMRIRDVKTSEVIRTSSQNLVRKSATAVNSQANLDVPTVLREASGLVANDLVAAVFPIKVLLVRPEGSLVLNYGQGSLEAGQLLRVYGKGVALQDGDRIVIDENPVGYIRVTDVGANTSQAAFVGGGCGPVAAGYTVRDVAEKDMKTAQAAIKLSQQKKAQPCPPGSAIVVKGG